LEALDDLDGIYVYVRDRSGDPRTADRYVARIKASCDGLSLFPERGTRRDDLEVGLRTMDFERRATIVFALEPVPKWVEWPEVQ